MVNHIIIKNAQSEYLNVGVPFKECKMSYGDYLEYWLDNYCRVNLKYNPAFTLRLSKIDKVKTNVKLLYT